MWRVRYYAANGVIFIGKIFFLIGTAFFVAARQIQGKDGPTRIGSVFGLGNFRLGFDVEKDDDNEDD